MWRMILGIIALLTISCSGEAQAQNEIAEIPQREQITPTITATPTTGVAVRPGDPKPTATVLLSEWASAEECADEVSKLFDENVQTTNAVKSVKNLTAVGFYTVKSEIDRACKREVFLQRYSSRVQKTLGAMNLNNKSRSGNTLDLINNIMDQHFRQCHLRSC